MVELSQTVGEKLRQHEQERLLVFHQERPEKPAQELFVDQAGRWLLRDFDPQKYPGTFILPALEKMHVVYAAMIDEYIKALHDQMLTRSRAVGRRMDAKEKQLGQPGALYDQYDEALAKIVDFYSQLSQDHWEAHKAAYLQELIDLLTRALDHWE